MPSGTRLQSVWVGSLHIRVRDPGSLEQRCFTVHYICSPRLREPAALSGPRGGPETPPHTIWNRVPSGESAKRPTSPCRSASRASQGHYLQWVGRRGDGSASPSGQGSSAALCPLGHHAPDGRAQSVIRGALRRASPCHRPPWAKPYGQGLCRARGSCEGVEKRATTRASYSRGFHTAPDNANQRKGREGRNHPRPAVGGDVAGVLGCPGNGSPGQRAGDGGPRRSIMAEA